MKGTALIVHTGGGLGDVLLSTPVIDTLADAGYQVDYLARTQTSSVLKNHRNLKNLLTINGKGPGSLKEMREWAARLKSENYSAALLLWWSCRWAWTLYWAGIPHRVGQDSRLLYSFLFSHRIKIRSEHGDEDTHQTEILLDYARGLGLQNDGPEVSFKVSEEASERARALLQQGDFGTLDGPLLGFHSGKGLPLSRDRWPVDHFAELASNLQSNLQARLVLTGGGSEVELVGDLSRQLQLPHANLAGQTDIETLGALAAEMDAFVCPDSGPMHVAAAVGTPVVAIFALDEDFPKRWAPFGVLHEVVSPVRPACPPNCKKPTCPNFSCYRKIRPEQLTEAVVRLLKLA